MKKILSVIMSMVILISVFTFGSTASAKTTKTTFNGKTAVKGQIVSVTYKLKAPEKMEDIQASLKSSIGLQIQSVSFSKKMTSGSFMKIQYSNKINFSSICIMNPMDFTTTTNLVTVKYKITGTGKLRTTLNLVCLGGVSGKKYGTSQDPANYKKLSLTTSNKMYAYSVKLNSKGKTLKKGKSYTLKATVTPSSASKKVTWSTTNSRVAKVNSKGKVIAVKKGTCYIKVKTTDGSNKSAKCKIKVR